MWDFFVVFLGSKSGVVDVLLAFFGQHIDIFCGGRGLLIEMLDLLLCVFLHWELLVFFEQLDV